MSDKYKNSKGYWKTQEGLRVPEIPHFNEEFLYSERVTYFIDHVAKRFCNDHEWWCQLETMHLEDLEKTMKEKEYKEMCENIENSGSDCYWVWCNQYGLPSGFEISCMNVILMYGKPGEEEIAKHNLDTQSCYTDDWERIWNEEEGYAIHNELRHFLYEELNEAGMWGKDLSNDKIKEYNEILNNLIGMTEYLTTKAICQIYEQGKTNVPISNNN